MKVFVHNLTIVRCRVILISRNCQIFATVLIDQFSLVLQHRRWLTASYLHRGIQSWRRQVGSLPRIEIYSTMGSPFGYL